MDRQLLISLYHDLYINNVLEDVEGLFHLLHSYIDEEDVDIADKEEFKKTLQNLPITLLQWRVQEALEYYVRKFEMIKIFKPVKQNGREYITFVALCSN